MLKNSIKAIISFFLAIFILSGCGDDDDPLPQLLGGFANTSIGLTLEDDKATVNLELSRNVTELTTLALTITEGTGTVYGVDYSTEPAASNGTISIEIPAGINTAQLVINKLKNPEFEEIKSFSIAINSISGDGLAGDNNKLSVTFEENPTSAGAELAPEVGGSEQPNQVYIDLSKQKATAIDKSNWDLAFNNASDFRVMLNYATYAMAKPTDKTVLADVTDAYVTEDFKSDMVAGIPNNTGYMDDPSGDLSKTAIAEIASDDANNLVYVINRGQLDDASGTERGYVKVKITRNEDDYVIAYGDINDIDNFSTVTITKGSDTNFTYFSFDDGVVTVEPAKDSWDIVMTTFTHVVPAGPEIYSYKYKDFVLTNSQNIKVTSVAVTDNVTYDGFSISDVSSANLENNRLGIGSEWRLFDFNTFSYTINAEVFYLIEDVDGNTYKLKFTEMLNTQGERGYPKFVYKLLN